MPVKGFVEEFLTGVLGVTITGGQNRVHLNSLLWGADLATPQRIVASRSDGRYKLEPDFEALWAGGRSGGGEIDKISENLELVLKAVDGSLGAHGPRIMDSMGDLVTVRESEIRL